MFGLRAVDFYFFAALVLATQGCAAGSAERPSDEPISSFREWVSTLHRDHVLVGRIWNVREQRFADERSMQAALARADFVLLGEIHDNPDHHLLQARLVQALVNAGRRPALAFEMLDTDKQPALDEALAGPAPSPEAVAAATNWKHSSWPDFSLYRPIFAVGIRAGLPLVAADLPRDSIRRFMSQGVSAFPAPVRELLARALPLTPELEEELEEEMEDVHCGQLPQSALPSLVELQRARDASLAGSILSADADRSPPGERRGAVLISGTGHVRTDRAVPAFIAREAPNRSVSAVAFLEVAPKALAPEDYGSEFGGSLPFDYVVFTPAAERRDPCLDFKKNREGLPQGQAVVSAP